MEKENIQDYFRENIYPRSYQVEILQSVNARIENHNRYQLIQMPVGSGQSFVISMIAMSSALKGKKVLIVGGRYADSMVKQFWKPQALDVVDITFWSDKEFISKSQEKDYDIAIFRSLDSVLSEGVKTNISEAIDNLAKSSDSDETELSVGQERLLFIEFLKKYYESHNTIFIDFEITPSVTVASYIASETISPTYKMSFKEIENWGNEVARDYGNYTKQKTADRISGENSDSINDFASYYQTASYVDIAKIHQMLNHIIANQDQDRQKTEERFNNLDAQLVVANSGIKDIKSEIDKLFACVKDINSSIADEKSSFEIFTSGLDEITEDAMTSKLESKIANDVYEKLSGSKNRSMYKMSEQLTQNYLGDAWNKMQNDSQQLLVMAQFLYNINLELGENVDYSSVCILSSKAIEKELSIRYVTKYEEYLRAISSNIREWPNELVHWDRQHVHALALTADRFTLGSVPFITGTKGKRDRDQQNCKDYFRRYCKDRLMKGVKPKNLDEKIQEHDQYVIEITDKYRNPAAHKAVINITTAKECLDYILQVEKTLKIMLDDFSF